MPKRRQITLFEPQSKKSSQRQTFIQHKMFAKKRDRRGTVDDDSQIEKAEFDTIFEILANDLYRINNKWLVTDNLGLRYAIKGVRVSEDIRQNNITIYAQRSA